MSEQNNLSYEEQWAQAFENAEIAPPSGVWNKVELSVTKSSNVANKKRVLFFKLLAAASITFAAVIGLGVVYNSYFDEAVVIADNETLEIGTRPLRAEGDHNSSMNDESQELNTNLKSEQNGRSKDNTAKERNSVLAKQKSDIASNQAVDADPNLNGAQHIDSKDNSHSIAVSGDDGNGQKTDLQSTSVRKAPLDQLVFNEALKGEEQMDYKDENVMMLINEDATTLEDGDPVAGTSVTSDEQNLSTIERVGVDLGLTEPGAVDFKMVPWYTYSSSSNKKIKDKVLWTGLAMSAGSFNPGAGSSSESIMPNSFSQDGAGNPAINEAASIRIGEERPGTSYGLGVNFGAQLSSKFVLLSGLNYLQQTTSSSSNVVDNGNVVSSFNEVVSFERVSVTNEYEIENTYQSVSVPIQAGYYLLRRRVGIMMLAGFSNDFFIRRNSSDEAGLIASESFNSSQDGYSLYSLGGLLGTQFSYQLGENYSIALQPQFKQNLNSFAPNLERPSSFEIGFRFNYLIK